MLGQVGNVYLHALKSCTFDNSQCLFDFDNALESFLCDINRKIGGAMLLLNSGVPRGGTTKWVVSLGSPAKGVPE